MLEALQAGIAGQLAVYRPCLGCKPTTTGRAGILNNGAEWHGDF